MTLSFRPPYDGEAVLALFRRHAVAGLESVDAGGWSRTLRTEHGAATVSVSNGNRGLGLGVHLSDNRDLMPVVARLRRMFDLDAQPQDIVDCLAADPLLSPLLGRRPGVRSPVFASPFEACVRAILGQQVSTAAARKLCGDIVAAANSRATIDGRSVLLFPTPAELRALPDDVLRMPATRRQTLRAVCEFFHRHQDIPATELLAGLADIRGVGPWTLDMVAMRGLGDPDRFPASDLGLLKAAGGTSSEDRHSLAVRSKHWQPWRSYAANLLWRSLGNG